MHGGILAAEEDAAGLVDASAPWLVERVRHAHAAQVVRLDVVVGRHDPDLVMRERRRRPPGGARRGRRDDDEDAAHVVVEEPGGGAASPTPKIRSCSGVSSSMMSVPPSSM